MLGIFALISVACTLMGIGRPWNLILSSMPVVPYVALLLWLDTPGPDAATHPLTGDPIDPER